jgi:hypothetical protein
MGEMNPAPQAARPSVASMEEFLRETLVETESMLELLDEAVDRAREEFRGRREHLRARLYALRLADDAAFDADVRRLADDLSSGARPATFSFEAAMDRHDQLERQGR